MNAIQFIGTWKLISCETRLASGEVSYPYGRNPQGVLMYDNAGHIAVQLMHPQRPTFGIPDKSQGTAEEIQAAINGYEGYFGTYEIDEEQKMVRHHVWGSLLPNWTGGHQVRFYAFNGDQLTLSTGEIPYNGTMLKGTLTWERIAGPAETLPAGMAAEKNI